MPQQAADRAVRVPTLGQQRGADEARLPVERRNLDQIRVGAAFPNAGKQKLPLSENAADQNDSVGTENRRQIVKPHRQMLRVGLQNGVRSRAACPRRLENRPAVDDVPRFADLPRQQAVRLRGGRLPRHLSALQAH